MWVVYKMNVGGHVSHPNAVCTQGEWDAMELARPGRHALIREGVTNEPEAERLARESPGGTAVPAFRKAQFAIGGSLQTRL